MIFCIFLAISINNYSLKVLYKLDISKRASRTVILAKLRATFVFVT